MVRGVRVLGVVGRGFRVGGRGANFVSWLWLAVSELTGAASTSIAGRDGLLWQA